MRDMLENAVESSLFIKKHGTKYDRKGIYGVDANSLELDPALYNLKLSKVEEITNGIISISEFYVIDRNCVVDDKKQIVYSIFYVRNAIDNKKLFNVLVKLEIPEGPRKIEQPRYAYFSVQTGIPLEITDAVGNSYAEIIDHKGKHVAVGNPIDNIVVRKYKDLFNTYELTVYPYVYLNIDYNKPFPIK